MTDTTTVELPNWLIDDIDALAAIRGTDRTQLIRLILNGQVTYDLELHRRAQDALARADRMIAERRSTATVR